MTKQSSIPAPVVAGISAMLAPYVPELADPIKLLHLLRRAEPEAASASDTKTNPQLVTSAQAAKLLSCCRRSVLNWIRDGRLSAVRIGHSVRIPLAEIERLAAAAVEARAGA
jgi:excisionase family DNA binding protein